MNEFLEKVKALFSNKETQLPAIAIAVVAFLIGMIVG